MSSLDDIFESMPASNEEHIRIIKKTFNIENINSCSGAIIFGTGVLGQKLLNIFTDMGIEIFAFSDNKNNTWNTTINGIPVLKPAEISKFPDKMIIIASKYVRELNSQLKGLGCINIVPHYVLSIIFPEWLPNEIHNESIKQMLAGKKDIVKVFSKLCDEKSKRLFKQLLQFRLSLLPEDLPEPKEEQYYPADIWEIDNNEIYVDVGAYDGDTFKQFLNHTGGEFTKYYALEPDKINYQKLLDSIPKEYIQKVFPLNVGAGSINGEAAFNSNGRDDASITFDGSDVVQIVQLDVLCKKDAVTTIKIDVEGYEPDVLAGSKELISTKKPKLAVCVYHRPNHLWQLTLQILTFNENYKLYLRHHEEEIYGSVLYAVQ